jgi:hypothetical protein
MSGQALVVMEELRRAGLPVQASVIYTEQTDPDGGLGTPGGPVQKIAFVDNRINPGAVDDQSYGSVELGGVVEVYADPANATRRRDTPLGPCWVFDRGHLLILLSPHLTEVQTTGYAHALRLRDGTPVS